MLTIAVGYMMWILSGVFMPYFDFLGLLSNAIPEMDDFEQYVSESHTDPGVSGEPPEPEYLSSEAPPAQTP